MTAKISDKTIERLSLYRRLLGNQLLHHREYIFSHELATLAHLSSAQVRRDLMVVNHMGNPNKGYNVAHIINEISGILGIKKVKNVGLLGVGNLGRALLSYFVGKRPDLPIVASFDTDSEKAGRVISGCRCYKIDEMAKIIKENDIKIMILAVPSETVRDLVSSCLEMGIKSFINFTHMPLNVPKDVFVENIDITLTIEKAAYFTE